MTVFVLFNGCYSDTRVVGVFSSQAHADLAARVFSDDASVQEFDLDAGVAELARDYKLYFVRLHRDTGDVLERGLTNSSYGAFSNGVGEDVNRNLYTHCFAASAEHAVKIASERRRAFLAGEPTPVDAVDPHAEVSNG